MNSFEFFGQLVGKHVNVVEYNYTDDNLWGHQEHIQPVYQNTSENCSQKRDSYLNSNFIDVLGFKVFFIKLL